jgi:hypothetical protein
LTYYARDGRELEGTLKSAKNNLCKLVVVTGPTKSGKTVLVKTIFPQSEVVWLDGGLIRSEDDFWREVSSALEVVTEVVQTTSRENSVGGDAKGSIKVPNLFSSLPIEAQGSVSHIRKRARTITVKRQVGDKSGAIKILRAEKTPIVIDDFHYLSRPLQGGIVRALKSVIADGCPVVFIAIPHRRYDVVKVEREMTGRFMPMNIPVWSTDELENIPRVGFPLLNVTVEERIVLEFSKQAIGSPHLMQEFCRALCVSRGITDTTTFSKNVQYDNGFDDLFKKVAESTGRTMFDKLKRGPSQRTDRIQRYLKNGTNTDIYGLVLLALASMKPGLSAIGYEELRSAIRDIGRDAPPQKHEVSNVLDHMSKISSSDESSTPVIEWDKEERVLHVTDPFFAYYLRWGLLENTLNEVPPTGARVILDCPT